MILIGGAQPFTGADPEMTEGWLKGLGFKLGLIKNLKWGGMLTYNLHSVQSMILL